MFLKQASSYPAYNGMIDAIESHLSWVFLTSEHAYKMKKPVKLPFLDLTSLAARKQSVKKELIANRVLAHGVYLGVVALTKDKENKLHLAQYTPDSAACEWLLKMKRLPHKLMLDNILKTGTCRKTLLHQAAYKLAKFYRSAKRATITPRAYFESLNARVIKNYKVLSTRRYGLDKAQVDAVHGNQILRLQTCAGLLKNRARGGHIIDGHGDLKAEHICLTSPPMIIDRLETRELRITDPIDELSYLWIECRILNHPEAADIFFETYKAVSGDNYPKLLPPLFKSLNACTRACFAAWHLDDPQVSNKENWRLRTAAYFALALEQ